MKDRSNRIILLFLISLSILVNSCSTNHKKEKEEILKTDGPSSDLIEVFDVGKKQAEEFKAETTEVVVKPVGPVGTPVVVVPVGDIKAEALAKKEAKKAAKELKLGKDKTAAVVAPAVTTTPTMPVVQAYPPGYPEEYKAYDVKSKLVWEKFKPMFYVGEQSVMSITYLGVTAGYITIISKGLAKIKDKDSYHYYARFKSSDAYRYFYWLDDYIESFVEKGTFLPLKYQLIQREKKQNVDDLQLFDFEKMMTYHWFKKVKEGQTKNEKIEKPLPRYAQDSFSALQFVRGLPLTKGDVYEIPVVTRGKIWQLKVEVDGVETTSVNGKDIRAIKIRAETSFPGVLKKSGDIIFWYGAEGERRLLKFQAKVKIGSIFGELVEYKPGAIVK